MSPGTLILAIDPGPVRSGWVLFDGERVLGGEPDIETAALIDLSAGWQAGVDARVAIEWITSQGMAVGADVFETCYQIGRIVQRYSTAGVVVQRISRRKVKLHLCGSSRAKDPNVRQALIDRFGGTGGKAVAVGTKKGPGPLYGVRSHMWAALAVAVTYADLYAKPGEAA